MKRLLTPRELSEIFGVKLSTIYQWSSQEFVPRKKLGRLLRFDEQDIERWLARRASGGRLTKKVKFPVNRNRKLEAKENLTKTEDKNVRDHHET